MQILLLRHPPVQVEAGTCYGHSDVAATPSRAEEIEALRARLPRQALRIHSSDLSRCRVLAEQLRRPPDALAFDARLREIHFGEWELRRYEHIERALIDDWAARPWDFVAPGGESAGAMSERVLAALDDALLESRASIALLIVSHGGPLRVIRGHLLGLPRERWLDFDPAPGVLLAIDA